MHLDSNSRCPAHYERIKMTEYVKKDGEGICFKKVSKKGTPYYNGSFGLGGKEFWISLFSKKLQSGEQAISFSIQPKEPKKETLQECLDKKEDGYDPVKNEFTDNIPF